MAGGVSPEVGGQRNPVGDGDAAAKSTGMTWWPGASSTRIHASSRRSCRWTCAEPGCFPGLRGKGDDHLAEVTTPAGAFRDCWVIETYQFANTNDTAWVCEGAGEVRRQVEKFAGSLRFTAETVLVGLTRPVR